MLNPWETDFLRFETPEQEVRKFERRLRALGALDWRKDWRITEMFCGRGSGLHALSRLGFREIQGLDLSLPLLSLYRGPGRILVCDCRDIPIADRSQDLLIVQGGLHHLLNIPSDLEQVLVESYRILRPGGILCIVEPWQDTYLAVVHLAIRSKLLRRIWPRLNTFATLVEYEKETYFNWLRNSGSVLDSLHRWFDPELEVISRGHLRFVGRRAA